MGRAVGPAVEMSRPPPRLKVQQPACGMVPRHKLVVEQPVDIPFGSEAVLVGGAPEPIGNSQAGEPGVDLSALRFWKKVRADDALHLRCRYRVGDVQDGSRPTCRLDPCTAAFECIGRARQELRRRPIPHSPQATQYRGLYSPQEHRAQRSAR